MLEIVDYSFDTHRQGGSVEIDEQAKSASGHSEATQKLSLVDG